MCICGVHCLGLCVHIGVLCDVGYCRLCVHIGVLCDVRYCMYIQGCVCI